MVNACYYSFILKLKPLVMIKLFKKTSSYTDSAAALRSSSIPVSNLGPKSYLVKIITYLFFTYSRSILLGKSIFQYFIFMVTTFLHILLKLHVLFTSCIFTSAALLQNYFFQYCKHIFFNYRYFNFISYHVT